MPVYGDMLASFPELLAEHTVFEMHARAGGGYGVRMNIRSVVGVFRLTPAGKMGIEADNRQPNEIASFWCYPDDGERIRQGTYLDEGSRGIFLITKDSNYVNEGGFIRFTAAAVPGPTDTQKAAPVVVSNAVNDF